MSVRERYMRLIRDFMDKPVIKIITGMRRSGKSALYTIYIIKKIAVIGYISCFSVFGIALHFQFLT